MAARSPASWLQGGSHPAENDRNLLAAIVGTPGVVGATDLAVTANSTPNMSINVAVGAAFIKGTEATWQGVYHAFNDAVLNLAIAASDPTNPRIDIVVAQVRDAYYSGSSNDFRLVVVAGTPAGTPAAPSAPADSIVLAQVAVAATATTIITGNITDYRVAAGYLGSPSGSVTAFAGAVAPAGWLMCDGSAVSRTTFHSLFIVLASTYGAGDGSTTFNLPDMRGRAPIGAGTGSGLTARALAANVGEENHALSTAELASHGHTAYQPGHSHTAWQAGHYHHTSANYGFIGDGSTGGTGSQVQAGTSYQLSPSTDTQTPAVYTATATPAVTVNNTGSGSGHNTMQPSLALNYIVKT